MPKLSPVSWKELVRRLGYMGFKGPFRGGKHPYMVRDDLVLTLPNPHRGEISIDLLKIEFDDRARKELRRLDRQTQVNILAYLRNRIATDQKMNL